MNHAPESEPLVVAEAISKEYARGRERVHALQQLSFQIEPGEFLAIVGPSGAGKTTLLNLLGCMDRPTSGNLRIAGRTVHDLSDSAQTQFRRKQVGFVFQHFGLLPTLTLAENVALPALFAGARNSGAALLERVGLAHRRHHRPRELSGGEMQRAAIARALVNEPSLLLADEPTGNLDTGTGETIIDLFRELNRGGLTIVVVTHNSRLTSVATRVLALKDGRLATTP